MDDDLDVGKNCNPVALIFPQRPLRMGDLHLAPAQRELELAGECSMSRLYLCSLAVQYRRNLLNSNERVYMIRMSCLY